MFARIYLRDGLTIDALLLETDALSITAVEVDRYGARRPGRKVEAGPGGSFLVAKRQVRSLERFEFDPEYAILVPALTRRRALHT